jgi:hypothetical protein
MSGVGEFSPHLLGTPCLQVAIDGSKSHQIVHAPKGKNSQVRGMPLNLPRAVFVSMKLARRLLHTIRVPQTIDQGEQLTNPFVPY